MPPTGPRGQYRALPVVERVNHVDGIAPYNGVVAVTRNSRVVPEDSAAYRDDASYAAVQRECERVAELLHATAPIRIDVRRAEHDPSSPFMLFDNMTGPGRPGREDQASLTALAAEGLGWDYGTLLSHVLASSRTLRELRNVSVRETGGRF
ncbi:uncharacterized protein PV09_05364 [Verruconis gallopava]|uniref:ATP-grasp domain-containing protein n=1 Tax=Verruconis gallopava TaxID=253628 RepID=A0A0D1XMB8_9PEZI|nr:uncharacterized protein PV09_05364 [Verruconis gallopava]KIW03611.1 hypothetical protein PV09_05364 [Verruconis gallopava]